MRIFSLSVLLPLLLVLPIPSFSQGQDDVQVVREKLHPDLPETEFRFHLKRDVSDPEVPLFWVSQIEVATGQEPVQTLENVSASAENSLYADQEGWYETVDLNFDGYKDLRVLVIGGAANSTSNVWLYDPASKKFAHSTALSEITSAMPDAEKKEISSYSNNGMGGAAYQQQTYRWENGQLVLVFQEEQDMDPDDPDRFLRITSERKDGALQPVKQETVEIRDGELVVTGTVPVGGKGN